MIKRSQLKDIMFYKVKLFCVDLTFYIIFKPLDPDSQPLDPDPKYCKQITLSLAMICFV